MLRALAFAGLGTLLFALPAGAFATPRLPCQSAGPPPRIPDVAGPGRPAKLVTASWYGPRHQGRPTASGEIFDAGALTATHPSLPFGTRLVVTNPRIGSTVRVCINDRGPFVRGRTLDLSEAAARLIGTHDAGTATVAIVVSR
ncbi:MAG: septal ring lytic transglycosylase RlpA family protein [Magnetospirillum sp.]|nr:septal ring lytic transglycosylase RlpA family protein [Magnetospirillum sp.]